MFELPEKTVLNEPVGPGDNSPMRVPEPACSFHENTNLLSFIM